MKLTSCIFLVLLVAAGAGAQSATQLDPARIGWSLNPTANAQALAIQSYNVLLSGAKCDGLTDDTNAIQAALTANAGTSTTAKATVVLPANTVCVVAGFLTMQQMQNFNLNGSTLKFTGTGGGACSVATNGLVRSFPGANYSTISNGSIDVTASSAGCLFNYDASTFQTGNAIKSLTVNATKANSTTGALIGNQGIFTDDNVNWNNLEPNSINVASIINVGSITRNRFSVSSGTQTTPFLSITGGVTALTVGGDGGPNDFEGGEGVYVNNGNQNQGLKIDANYIEGGTCASGNAYGIWVMGTSGTEIGWNDITASCVAIQVGSATQSGLAIPKGLRVIGNLLFGASGTAATGILDYGLADIIENNAIANYSNASISEYGVARIEGNYLISAPTGLLLNSSFNFIGTNTYYAVSPSTISCPNGGNMIFDTGTTPSANCTGIVAGPNSLSVGGPISSINAGSAGQNNASSVLLPGLATGNQMGVQVGTAANSTNNSVALFFSNVGGAGSALNFWQLSIYGAYGVVGYGNGDIFIGTTPADCGQKLCVNGTMKAGGSAGNFVPLQSTGAQTTGDLACIKAAGPPVIIGTCTAVSGASCTTCN